MLIIASIGNQSVSEEKINKIILAGADVIRYNFTSPEETEKYIEHIKTLNKVREELNTDIKIMIDFPLNKTRLGDFENQIFAVRENEEFIFQSARYSPDCLAFVPVNTKNLGEKVRMNQMINLGNGRIALQVTEIVSRDIIKMKVLNNGIIKSKQTFNNGILIDDSEMSKIYNEMLNSIIPLGPHYIAISYLNEEFNNNLPLSSQINNQTKIIIKIEKEVTNAELEKICQDPTYAMILMDRGEMGVNMPFEKIGIYQKNIMTIGKKFNKAILISTQTLDSTIDNFVPSRSDILDLTNTVLDGAAGLVLSKETSDSRRPIYAITVAKKIIYETKKYKNHQK